MSRTALVVFLACAFLLPSSADEIAPSPLASPAAFAPLPVVVDTDMGMDDLRAVALLLESPRVRVLGLTTVFGSTGPGKGAANLARLLSTLEERPLPLSAGADEPLAGSFDKPPWRPMCEAVGGVLWGPGEQVVLHERASQLLARLVRKGEGKATVLCLGPLTNLARALEEDPGLAAVIHILVVACAGTADGEPHFNLAADPVAAERVLRAPIGRIVFVPAPRGERGVDFSRAMEALREERIETPAARALVRIFGDGQPAELLAAGHFLLGDDLAALFLVRPALFALDGPFCAAVETRGPARGRIRRTGGPDAGNRDAARGVGNGSAGGVTPSALEPPGSSGGEHCRAFEAGTAAPAGRIARTLVDSLAGLLPPADPPAPAERAAAGLAAPGNGDGGTMELEASVLRSFPPLAPDLDQDDVARVVGQAVARHGAAEWRGAVLATEMHGHLGIYSLIGVKMGLRALEILGAPRAEVEVTPHCGSEPPLSCLQDGLMAATGATPGRGLLLPSTSPRVTVSSLGASTAAPIESSPLSATFAYGEREVTLSLKPEVAQQVAGQLVELLKRHGGRQDADYFREVRAAALRLYLELDRDWIFVARR